VRVATILGLAVLPCLPILLAVGDPDAVTYRVINSRSRIEVAVKSEGFTNAATLVLQAYEVTGSIVYDAVHPSRSRITIRVPVQSLSPVSPRLPAAGVGAFLAFMRGYPILYMERFPEIAFLGSGVEWGSALGSGYRAVRSPGLLEIRGRRTQVLLQGIAHITTAGLEVSGRHYVHLHDHGVARPYHPESSIQVKDDVEVNFHIFAVPEKELELRDDEVHPPKLTDRGEHSGELTPRGEPPDMKRKEPDLKTPSGELAPGLEPR